MVDNGLPEQEKARCIFGVRGGSVKGILMVLLALGVCFSYFYFFTDIFRSTQETSPQIDVSSTEVKKPLPERAVQTAVTSAREAVRVAPVAPGPPVDTSAPAVDGLKQAQSPAASSVKPSDAHVVSGKLPSKPTSATTKPAAAPEKPVPLPGKQKDTAVKVTVSETGKTSNGKTSSPVVSAKPVAKTLADKSGSKDAGTPLSPKKAAVESKPVSSPSAKQKLTPAKQVPEKKGTVADDAGKTIPKKEGKGFSLVVGTYVLQSTLKADKAKLERAGLHPSVAAGPMKNQPMNRLVVADYDSYTTARAELDRVKKANKDAFLLQENGRFTVYAGSYYRHDRAVEEQERLREQGFAPVLKKSVAPVASWKLMVEGFQTREEAQREAAKLGKLGFKPLPIQSGIK